MRLFWASLLVALSAAVGSAQAPGVTPVQTAAAAVPPGPTSAPPSCHLYGETCARSKQDARRAEQAVKLATELQKRQQLDDAVRQLDLAAQLAPQDGRILTAREMARQQAVSQHLQRGNQFMTAKRPVEAVAEFSAAAHLDPQNEFVQQRLRDSLGESGRARLSPRLIAAAEPVEIEPKAGTQNFHFRGDSRQLLQQVAQAFGLSTVVDDSVTSRRVRFDLEEADFTTAMQLACSVTKSFYTPLAEKQLLLANDSAENRKAFEKMALRTFYVPGASSAQDFTDLTNLLRTVFEVKMISQQPSNGTITLRAPVPVLQAATRFMEANDPAKPQVLLDVNVIQVGHSFVRQMGINAPTSFSMFNIPANALKALGGQNIQDLINQLIASGGINAATQQSIAALLAQLQNQQQGSSLFSQPLATFGGGLTFFGLTLGNLNATFKLDESQVQTLEHLTLHASHGSDATFMVGSRIPILNASYAPAFNSSAISQVLGNQTYQPAFPSFSYEDIGLKMKAKPFVHATDVTMDLELSIRTLSGNSLNGVPVIANREYKGQITVKDGEQAVVAGAVDRSDIRSTGGLPLIGQIPVLHNITANNNRQETDDELLIVITPHIMSLPNRDRAPEIWMAPAK